MFSLISHGNPSTNYGRYETNPEKSVNALAADLMAGHIPIVAEMHYARKEGVLMNEVLKTAFQGLAQIFRISNPT
jgi:hypothetical protein